MQRAKTFLLVSAGVFLLTLSYNVGATSAGAQTPGNSVVAAAGGFVVAANGNVYADPVLLSPSNASQWLLAGNVFGAPVSAAQETWGQLKARYR